MKLTGLDDALRDDDGVAPSPYAMTVIRSVLHAIDMVDEEHGGHVPIASPNDYARGVVEHLKARYYVA